MSLGQSEQKGQRTRGRRSLTEAGACCYHPDPEGHPSSGDFIACGAANGKVRAMTDEKESVCIRPLFYAGEIIGLNAVPDAGEVLVALDSDKEAKDFAATFVRKRRTFIEETKTQMSLDDLFEQIKKELLKNCRLLRRMFRVRLRAVTQNTFSSFQMKKSSLRLSTAASALLMSQMFPLQRHPILSSSAFNVRPDATAKAMADTQKVDIHLYNVIYEAIGDVEKALKACVRQFMKRKYRVRGNTSDV